MDHLSKWTLKSLTIGPQIHETDREFWEEAFRGLPPLPGVDNITIIYNYPTARAFNTHCWEYFDRLLSRRDLFPALGSVHVQPSIGARQTNHRRWWAIYSSLRRVRSKGLVRCELFAFARDNKTYSSRGAQLGSKLANNRTRNGKLNGLLKGPTTCIRRCNMP